ncbi:MAG: GatB/YqeY domain-containing protein [Anaerolineae bacterium]|nr:GatB/YqeY domain-containing protein [Anaerolineae bacterium]
MSLQDRLMDDLKEAMRSKDVARREAIRMVRAAVQNAEIEWQRKASDEDVQALIAREVRRRTEALEMFRQGGRADLVAEEEAGIAVLESYLPEQLSQDDIETVVRQVIAQVGATSMGQMGAVMREAMAQLKGQADGRLVNQIVRELLSQA